MKMPLKVLVITQNDEFVIPRNVEKIARAEGTSLRGVIVLDVKGSLANKKSYFARGFGPLQTCKMGMQLVAAKLAARTGRRHDLRQVAEKAGASFQRVEKLHSAAVIEMIREMSPDVIVSFSAPCVFKPEILNIPQKGCINLHCSLLPRYAGLLPSFWVLFHKEKVAGASVHYMDDRIDNGAILGQREVTVSDQMTMFELIQKTKKAGGDLMVEVLEKIRNGEVAAMPNRHEEGSYFTWPTIQQMHDFRRAGGRLI